MIRDDLLGKQLEVVDAKSKTMVGITGEVIDETKHTLRIRTDRGEKTLIKEQVTVQVDDFIIKGDLMTTQPERRTKLKIKKWQRKQPKNQ